MGDAAGARFIDLRHQGALTGRRLVVRWTPDEAVRRGVDALLAQGFARHDKDLDQALRAEGSEWTAQALWIGSRKKSWLRGIVADVVEEVVPVDVIPGLRRGIAPTMAVVTARADADGATELYIVPLSEHNGDPQAPFGAAPLVRKAIADVREDAEQSEALVSVDPPILGVADPACPAARATAERLLGTSGRPARDARHGRA